MDELVRLISHQTGPTLTSHPDRGAQPNTWLVGSRRVALYRGGGSWGSSWEAPLSRHSPPTSLTNREGRAVSDGKHHRCSPPSLDRVHYTVTPPHRTPPSPTLPQSTLPVRKFSPPNQRWLNPPPTPSMVGNITSLSLLSPFSSTWSSPVYLKMQVTHPLIYT
jgi:hypothetical protein